MTTLALPANFPDLLTAAVIEAVAPLVVLAEEIAQEMRSSSGEMHVTVMRIEFQLARLKRELHRLRQATVVRAYR